MSAEVSIRHDFESVHITIHDPHVAQEYAELLWTAATKTTPVDSGFWEDYKALEDAREQAWSGDVA